MTPLSVARPVDMLWTGGWDSTFQLLRVVLQHGRAVQPHYLIDTWRRSTGVEILTMHRIRERLAAEYPRAGDLLLPVRYAAVVDIAPNPEMTAAFHAVRKKGFIGGQYDWLARFCLEHGLHDLQLCIERGGMADAMIGDRFVEVDGGGHLVFRLDPRMEGDPLYTLFGRFCFPVLDLDKHDMQRIVRERGWTDLMSLTWFCHSPRGGKSPRACGTCNPCQHALKEGFGWRIPAASRLRGTAYRFTLRPLVTACKRLTAKKRP